MDVRAIDVKCSGKYCYALAAINIVFAAITIPANAMILMAMYRLSRKRPLQASYLLIASLAATDLLSGCIPQSIFGYLLITEIYNFAKIDVKDANFWLASIMCYSSYMLCGVSLLLVAIMSIACLLAVVRPAAYRANKYRPGIIYAIRGSWLVCSLFPILRLVSRETVPPFNCILIGGIAVSLLVIFVSYILVISLTLFRRRPIFEGQQLQPRHIVISRSQPSSCWEKRMIRSFATIAVILVMMYLPQLIIKPLMMKSSKDLIKYLVQFKAFANTLLFCNSFVNPFMYAFRHKKIRQAIRSMFKNICQKKPTVKSPVILKAKMTSSWSLDSRGQDIYVLSGKTSYSTTKNTTNHSETFK